MKKILLFLVLLMPALCGSSQVAYEDVSNTGIYEFLDELATLRFIRLNSAIKPYSRNYIAAKLHEAALADTVSSPKPGKKVHKLNSRQLKELEFYLQDYQLEASAQVVPQTSRLADGYDHKLNFLFPKQENMVMALNPFGYHYRDSLFTFSLRPVLGVQWMTSDNGTEYHRWWGASMFGYIGKNFGFYANLRDNNASTAPATPEYFNQARGAVYKTGSSGGVDYSEMCGGIVASVSWGSIGIMNDRVVWGDNYHGANILSGKAPPFPYLHLHLNPARWFDFNYIHGWLSSNVVDSSNSYYSGGIYREVYRNKYIAANMFTFIPWRGLNLSFGNSIIYSDINVNPVYLIPFLFYNSVDATKNNYVDYAGSNSQLFFNFSSRQIRHLHLFVSLFIDEWKMSRVTDPDLNNFTSLKAGFQLSGFPLQNVALTAEYTRTQPMTYDHYLPATTFRSNDFSMGHYLRENSQEIYIALGYRPLRGVFIGADYTIAQHGDDVPYLLDAGYSVTEVPFMENVAWQNHAFGLSARYEFTANGYFFIRYLNSSREGLDKYQPPVMNGVANTFMAGINVGF